jgi:hypothetical protein
MAELVKAFLVDPSFVPEFAEFAHRWYWSGTLH